MTPKEFIASLRARYSPSAVTPGHLSSTYAKFIAAKVGKSVDELAQSVSELDYGSYLLSLLKPRLPAGIVALFDEGVLAVGGINDPTPNAYVKRVGNRGYAIVLHTGMRDLLYRVMRILATRARPRSDADQPVDMPELHETARLMAEVFWWLKVTNPPRVFGPDYAITPDRISFAAHLTIEAGMFLLAHEIGHALHEGADEMFTQLTAPIGSARSAAHLEEHSADIVALALTLGCDVAEAASTNPTRLMYTYAGAELALQIYHALGQCLPALISTSTHPPAKDRLAHIRSVMASKCDTPESWCALSSTAMALESMLTEMVRIIQTPGEHAQFFEQQAKSIAREFNDLLDRCSVDELVPDYSTFYEEASCLFGRGYSHKLLEHVAEVAAAYAAGQSGVAGSTQQLAQEQQYRRAFRKFKLVYGFIDGIPEPARTLFKTAFARRFEG